MAADNDPREIAATLPAGVIASDPTAATLPTATPAATLASPSAATLPAARADADAAIALTMISSDDGASAPGATPRPSGRISRNVIDAETGDYRELVALDPRHFVLGNEIARGGMGRILAARDRRLGRPVAIKELLTSSPDLRARFEREAHITAKLQHPAIVSILEAGTWPNGEPFYVMKLVTGESLDKAIAARTTLEARLGLLPNMLATIDALAYAHDKRVIHRDLKPHNVLVGEFGETVVIDWGLAKDLADTDAVSDVQPASSTPGATLVGAVLGTPAYMPAEQATGEPVDARADVYALGAMLYHLLVGAPPYDGTTSNEILAQVIAGPPRAIGKRLVGNVPADLVTIVDKAMAYAAADRYPTAKELADDLKKFQTGQLVGAHRYSAWQLVRRWVRRRRAPIAIAAAAVVVLAVVGVVSVQRIVAERDRTEQQRQAAETSRGEADDLTSFMLGDLAARLRPLGKLDLLDAVATKAISYYDGKRDDTSDAERTKSALARRNLGDVLVQEGHHDDAAREFRASLQTDLVLLARDPANADKQRDVSISLDRVADIRATTGDLADALADYRAALAIDELHATQDPANADRRRELAVSYTKIGTTLFQQGDDANALVAYRTALAITSASAAADPTNITKQLVVSSAHERIGTLLGVQGNTAGALAEHRTSVAIATASLARDPTSIPALVSLGFGNDRVGSVLATQGDRVGALTAYRAAQQIRERLVARDPVNVDWQRELAYVGTEIADVELQQRDFTTALVEYRAALATYEVLAAQDPTNDAAQRAVAKTHGQIGMALVRTDDLAGALADLRVARAIREKLAAKDPTNGDAQSGLGLVDNQIGGILLAQHDPTAALEMHLQARALYLALMARDHTNDLARWAESDTERDIGDAVLARGDAPTALADYRGAAVLREQVVARDPTSADKQRSLSQIHDRIGDVLAAHDDLRGALVEYRAAFAIDERLVALQPSNANWQTDVSLDHSHLGDTLLALHDDAGALVEYRAELAIDEVRAAASPSDDTRGYVADSEYDVCNALAATGDLAGALAPCRIAARIRDELLARDPKDPDRQSDVADSRQKLRELTAAIAHGAPMLAPTLTPTAVPAPAPK